MDDKQEEMAMANESAFEQLIGIIRSKSSLIEGATEEEDDRPDLFYLFMKAVRKTLGEIKDGASVDDFADLSVVNLIIMGAKSGYDAEEMKDFIQRLKNDDEERSENDLRLF